MREKKCGEKKTTTNVVFGGTPSRIVGFLGLVFKTVKIKIWLTIRKGSFFATFEKNQA